VLRPTLKACSCSATRAPKAVSVATEATSEPLLAFIAASSSFSLSTSTHTEGLPMTAQVAEALLPRVSGRHRDRALASARKCRAIQLKLQGLTYQQIADELGYTSRGTVYKIIKTAQATQLTGAVEEHLDIEVSRLNALQAAVWPAAMSGTVSNPPAMKPPPASGGGSAVAV